ncbi:M23 family metallopeptidase [Actinomyces howellii]|uniref:Membrane-bound metallopeptidase n=1 Tax=Actinomyces howellii TaxID=52771 RepID=A0A448HF77_9ACTO|nr:M23 family metallopeptidase [Actinomyces howellii]VEG26922.1 Membrane-bound metallopeptidase [Actinomyces howellii]
MNTTRRTRSPLTRLGAAAACTALLAPGGLAPSPATWAESPGRPFAASPGEGQTDLRPAPRSGYSWPTGGPVRVLEPFDPPAVTWGRGHRGVDLDLPAGSPVRAAGTGTVAFAGMVAGRPVVSIDHADGIRTTYEPVEPSVSAGEPVTAGQVIGVLRTGHRADGLDALHWGARTSRTTYVNPLRLLAPAVIRLKPLEGG